MTALTALRRLGRTPLMISPLTLGTSSWGPLRPGESADGRDARIAALADRFLAGDLETKTLDTSNLYGATPDGPLAERLIGAARSRARAITPGLVLQTKLDRDPRTGDFSAGRMRDSLEESLERLGSGTVDVLFLHDPEAGGGFDEVMRPGGAVEELVAMRDEGATRAVGISGGPVNMLEHFVATDIFDAVITHNRYTLLDRSADELINLSVARGVAVLNAAPYGGGALTGSPAGRGTYGYRPISSEAAAARSQLEALGRDVGVPLSTLALGFAMRDARITSTIVGASSIASWERAVHDSTRAEDLADDVWAEVDAIGAGLPPHDG